MSLRIATETDLPSIVAIYNATIPGRQVTADTEPVTLESRKGWFQAHQSKSHPLWVLEEKGTVVAWMSFSPFHPRPAYWPTAEVSIYVAEDCRGRGLGKYLLKEAISRAKQGGLRSLVGLIWGHNAPSLALFSQFGFETWGHLPRVAEMDQVERDLVIVGLRVTEN